jgi:hypothetical protein
MATASKRTVTRSALSLNEITVYSEGLPLSATQQRAILKDHHIPAENNKVRHCSTFIMKVHDKANNMYITKSHKPGLHQFDMACILFNNSTALSKFQSAHSK